MHIFAGTTRRAVWLPLLAAMVLTGCREDEIAPIRGPFLLACSTRPATISSDNQQERAVALWVRSLPVDGRHRLAVALDDAADAMDLLIFDDGPLLMERPEDIIATTLQTDGAGLAAFQALARAEAGSLSGERSLRLNAQCPRLLEAGCKCFDTRAGRVKLPGEIQAAVWPLVFGAAVLPSASERLDRLARCLAVKIRASEGQIGAFVSVNSMLTMDPLPAELIAAASRCQRHVFRTGSRFRAAAPLLAGIINTKYQPPAWAANHNDEVWLFPRLGRVASQDLPKMIELCLDSVDTAPARTRSKN